MKKILAMAAIALFTITSCSDDSNPNPDSNNAQTGTKLKTIITTDSDSVRTSNLVYDGNKIMEVNHSDGTKSVYTYTGDLITDTKTFDTNNKLIFNHIYQYNSQNQLVTDYELYYETEDAMQVAYKTTFEYNSDGTISFAMYFKYNFTNLNNFSDVGLEGIITDTTVTNIFTSDGNIHLTTYAFDGKNSPFKNITGMDKIGIGRSTAKKSSNENIVSRAYSLNGSPSVIKSNTVYTYNAANYPLTQTETSTDGFYTTTTQYIYE